jgi:hypothetical protein
MFWIVLLTHRSHKTPIVLLADFLSSLSSLKLAIHMQPAPPVSIHHNQDIVPGSPSKYHKKVIVTTQKLSFI